MPPLHLALRRQRTQGLRLLPGTRGVGLPSLCSWLALVVRDRAGSHLSSLPHLFAAPLPRHFLFISRHTERSLRFPLGHTSAKSFGCDRRSCDGRTARRRSAGSSTSSKSMAAKPFATPFATSTSSEREREREREMARVRESGCKASRRGFDEAEPERVKLLDNNCSPSKLLPRPPHRATRHSLAP